MTDLICVRKLLSAYLAAALAVIVLGSCGYKSDLYLPGESLPVERLNLPAIESLTSESGVDLRQEKKPEPAVAPGTLPGIGEGVAVEIPPLDTQPAETN